MVRFCLKNITNSLYFGDILKADIRTVEKVLPVYLLFYIDIGCMRLCYAIQCCERKQTWLCNIVRVGCGNHCFYCVDEQPAPEHKNHNQCGHVCRRFHHQCLRQERTGNRSEAKQRLIEISNWCDESRMVINAEK